MERRVAKRNLYFRLIQSIRDIAETVSKTRVRNEAVFARSPYRVTDNIAGPAPAEGNVYIFTLDSTNVTLKLCVLYRVLQRHR